MINWYKNYKLKKKILTLNEALYGPFGTYSWLDGLLNFLNLNYELIELDHHFILRLPQWINTDNKEYFIYNLPIGLDLRWNLK